MIKILSKTQLTIDFLIKKMDGLNADEHWLVMTNAEKNTYFFEGLNFKRGGDNNRALWLSWAT